MSPLRSEATLPGHTGARRSKCTLHSTRSAALAERGTAILASGQAQHGCCHTALQTSPLSCLSTCKCCSTQPSAETKIHAVFHAVAVWGTQAADATSRLDVAAAAACTAKAIAVVASLLEKQIAVVGQPSVVVTVAGIFDPAALGAFQRLWQRCKLLGIDFWHLLWRGTATDWELCMTNSFAAGASLHLEESTIIQQVRQAAFACMHSGLNKLLHSVSAGGGRPFGRICVGSPQGNHNTKATQDFVCLALVLTLLLPTTGCCWCSYPLLNMCFSIYKRWATATRSNT